MEIERVNTRDCDAGMKLAKGLTNPFGVVIFPAETPITPCVKELLLEMKIYSIDVIMAEHNQKI